MQKATPKNHKLAKEMMLMAGAVAVAAAAAGTYFLYGSKNAAKNRQKVKGWMLKAKGEILEKLENATHVSEQMYHKVINEVAAKYKALKHIDKKDVEAFVKELKSHWKHIEKQVNIFHKKHKAKK